jgi:hypothetical protein
MGNIVEPYTVQFPASKKVELECNHKFITYVGFTDSYEYCECCNVKKIDVKATKTDKSCVIPVLPVGAQNLGRIGGDPSGKYD